MLYVSMLEAANTLQEFDQVRLALDERNENKVSVRVQLPSLD